MAFFSVVPPSNWRTETDNRHRLASGAGNGENPPFLIIEACSAGSDQGCPARCDLPTIEGSGIVKDLKLSFTAVERRDGYTEYAASRTEDSSLGPLSSSFRLLCGPGGFVYSAFVRKGSTHDFDSELDAVIRSIEWKTP